MLESIQVTQVEDEYWATHMWQDNKAKAKMVNF